MTKQKCECIYLIPCDDQLQRRALHKYRHFSALTASSDQSFQALSYKIYAMCELSKEDGFSFVTCDIYNKNANMSGIRNMH